MMIIKGQSVYLRTTREKDLDMLHDNFSDLEGRGLYFPIQITSERSLKKDFEENGFISEDDNLLLICDLHDNILGSMFAFKATSYFNGLEVGYRIFKEAQYGRGIMTEALLLCTYLLFAWKPINRLELKIVPENTASRRVAEKCGYQLEGVARKCIFLRGKHQDMAIYSILREEAPTSHEETLARIAATRTTKAEG